MNMELKDKRNKDSGNAFTRYIKSFKHALDGFIYSMKNEHNMLWIFPCAIITIILGICFSISEMEWIICTIVIALVLASEMINTSIEATIDLVTLEKKPLAKISKDTASTATLIFVLMAIIVGLIIFLPKVLELL